MFCSCCYISPRSGRSSERLVGVGGAYVRVGLVMEMMQISDVKVKSICFVLAAIYHLGVAGVGLSWVEGGGGVLRGDLLLWNSIPMNIPLCLNYRVIKANILDVQNFWTFMVTWNLPVYVTILTISFMNFIVSR